MDNYSILKCGKKGQTECGIMGLCSVMPQNMGAVGYLPTSDHPLDPPVLRPERPGVATEWPAWPALMVREPVYLLRVRSPAAMHPMYPVNTEHPPRGYPARADTVPGPATPGPDAGELVCCEICGHVYVSEGAYNGRSREPAPRNTLGPESCPRGCHAVIRAYQLP